jgi:RNA-binding protein YhbY
MGAILATMDKNNNVVNVTSENKALSADILNTYKNYLNKHGVIKVKISQKRMGKFIKNYMKKVYNFDDELINTMIQQLNGRVEMGTNMLSSFGFIAMRAKSTEKFGVSGIEDNVYGSINNSENFASVKTCTESDKNSDSDSDKKTSSPKPKIEFKSDKALLDKNAKDTILAASIKGSKTGVKPVVKPVVTPVVKPVVKPVVTPSLKPGVKPVVTPSLKPADKGSKKGSKKGKSKRIVILIPKIYLTENRNEFIDFVVKNISPMKEKVVVDTIKRLMDALNKGGNTEIKIANMIGLTFRLSLAGAIMMSLKQSKKYTQENIMKILTGIISEFLENFPSDRCVFYDKSMNFLKFYPKVCDKKMKHKCPTCANKCGPMVNRCVCINNNMTSLKLLHKQLLRKQSKCKTKKNNMLKWVLGLILLGVIINVYMSYDKSGKSWFNWGSTGTSTGTAGKISNLANLKK